MFKIFIIVVIFVTGHYCRAISDEVPVENNQEERTAAISDNAASKAANSENTQELSKEASTNEEEQRDNSAKSGEIEERQSADSSNTGERHVRSTEDSRAANTDDRKATPKTNAYQARRVASSETSDASTKSSSNENKGDSSSRTSRNSEENYSDTSKVRSDTQESKSGSVETETAERDDVSHINIKETRVASEESVEGPSYRSSSEHHSKSASTESENSKIASGESNNAGEASQLRSGKHEEDVRSSSDVDQDDARSGSETDVGVEALVRSDIAALAEPATAARRMLEQNSNLRYDTIETSDSADTADTRMAPQEYIPLPGHEVHSNYFGSSRSSQSQYPYSPLESSSPLPFLPFSFSKESPPIPSSLSKLISPISLRVADSTTENSPRNTMDNNRSNKLLFPPMDPNKLFRMPPRPQHDRMGLMKPLPPLPPLDLNKPFQMLPPLPPLEPIGQLGSLPPLPTLESFGEFKPLPRGSRLLPLEPFGQYRPLPQLPPLEPIGLFKSHQPLLPMDRQTLPEQSQEWRPTCIGCDNSPNDNWQPQQSLQNLYSSLQSLNSMTNLSRFKPNTFSSMLRQAAPEESPQMSGSFSRSWNTFETAPMTVRSAYSFQSSH